MKLEQLRDAWQDLCRGTSRAAADARGRAAKAGQGVKTGAARAGQSVKIGAAKATQSARAGVTKAGQAAENVVAYTRLRRRINELRGARSAQLQKVGELVYATHRGNPTDSDTMQQALEVVDALADEIARKERELAAIRGVCVCGVCGAANPTGHVYCTQCGQPLHR